MIKRAFILGNPRSGTSLLRLMLNAHPNIVSPPESGFLQWWFEKYKGWGVQNLQSTKAIQDYVSDVLNSKKIETWNLNQNDLINLIHKECPKNYTDLSSCIFKLYALSKGFSPSVIIDKNNYYIHHLKILSLIWPDASYIYLIRDGRDVACSYREVNNINTGSPYKPALPSNIEVIAKEWNDNNIKIQKFLITKESHNWIKIRYEDLIRKPLQVLKSLTNFFELRFSENMLNYFDYNDEPQSTLDWKKKTLNELDIKNIGKYINQLSKKEIEQFNFIARDGLNIGQYKTTN